MNKSFLINIFLLIGICCLSSCTGKLEKTWTLTQFDKNRSFKIISEKGKSYNSAIITISGSVDEDVCFTLDNSANSEWCTYFSASDSKIRFTTDFYGVGKFELYMLPSNARGNLKLTIELPYMK